MSTERREADRKGSSRLPGNHPAWALSRFCLLWRPRWGEPPGSAPAQGSPWDQSTFSKRLRFSMWENLTLALPRPENGP